MQYDLIIVGAGIAGHCLVQGFDATGKNILVLEAGPTKPSALSQAFYKGFVAENSLPHSAPEEWRTRALGGSSNCWGGGVVPFDEEDFLKRDKSGRLLWPIAYSELLPFYDSVKKILGIDINESTVEIFRPNSFSIFSDQSQLDSFTSKLLLRKGGEAIKFSTNYKRPSQIKFLVNHQVMDFEINNGRVVALVVYNHETKSIEHFSSKNIILTAGGLETTRIILTSKVMEHIPHPELVGKFYTPHINQPLGLIVKTTANSTIATDYKSYNKTIEYRTFLSPSSELIQKGAINAKIMFEHHIVEPWSAFNLLASLWKKNVFQAIFKKDILQVHIISDQEPNELSRVYLSNKKGKDNIPQLIIDHQCTTSDYEKIDKVAKLLAVDMEKKGWMYYPKPVSRNTTRFDGASHHLGTLRMASEAEYGVVDKNLRVYGVDNLFICSGAVFPSASHANPTFTIAALASRLASFIIKEKLI